MSSERVTALGYESRVATQQTREKTLRRRVHGVANNLRSAHHAARAGRWMCLRLAVSRDGSRGQEGGRQDEPAAFEKADVDRRGATGAR